MPCFEDGDAVRLSGVLTDIGEQRAREDQLLHDSLHDALTGLANRVLLIDRLDHAVQRSVWEPRRRYGVLLIDLDGFKAVNDNYGHAAGDALLVDLAERMVAAVRPGDTVARLGGDEFGVLADSFIGSRTAFDALAARLRTAFATAGDPRRSGGRGQRKHRRRRERTANRTIPTGPARTGRRRHVPGEGRPAANRIDDHAAC